MGSINDKAYEKIALVLKSKATTSIEDALFITKESRNLPHIAHLGKMFGIGFISHPESWWATNLQILAYMGYFGKHQQHHAIIRQSIFSSLLGYGFHHPIRTGRVLFWLKAGHLDDAVAAIAGRFAGAKLITNRFIYSKKYNHFPDTKTSYVFKLVSSYFHSCYGLGMMSIAQGVRSLENLLFAMITGSQSVLGENIYMELKEIDISDYEAYQYYDEVKLLLQKLLYLNTEQGYKEHAKTIFRP